MLVFALPGGAAAGVTEDGRMPIGVLRVAEHGHHAVEVPKWDASSPQRLVRIGGKLYQEDSGLYFEVLNDRITVRLAEGVDSWDDLVTLAVTGDPRLVDALSPLEPIRKNRLGIIDLAVPEGVDLVALCASIDATGLVRYAEVVTRGFFVAAPNDPQYLDQWNLNNTGQNGGTPGADVEAEAAWEITAGDSSIVVAVLDSGTDVDHEDLAQNTWHNDDEIPNNGQDDDANGFIDDWEGWDFHNDNNEVRPVHYHGTHVTGIVNAAGDNGVGIAGLAGGLGGPGVLTMAVGVGDEAENVDVIDDGILYAADNGAHVITMSLSTAETQAINDALDYAYNVKDVFIDCAAGNGGSEVNFPARRPEVMAVASTDRDDEVSSFSNPGPEIEIAAPGSDIRSTRPNNAYSTGSGTSYAAPHVAALAALILGENPALSALDVRELIIETADDVEAPGFDVDTGHGRINALAAVTLAATSDGIVRMDTDRYSCADVVELKLYDFDLAGTGTAAVTATSDVEPGGESVTLGETATGSGVFVGSIVTSSGAAIPDGVLQVGHGVTIAVEYLDADDGAGGTGIPKTDTAVADCVGPAIADVGVTAVSDVEATLVWNTDEPATSEVTWGTAVPPGQLAGDAALTTSHAITLGGLQECTLYHYSVAGEDVVGNVSIDDNEGAYFYFETWRDLGGTPWPCHAGRISVDTHPVACAPAAVPVTVSDVDLDTDPGLAETVAVWLSSSTETSPETVMLTETGPNTGLFTGSIATAVGPATPGDGVLQTASGDLVTARYEDGDDGTGAPATQLDSVTVDCDGPGFDSVEVTEITDEGATLAWTSSEPATGVVEWGPTPALGSQAESDTLQTSHAVTVGGLLGCERVYFRIVATDGQGNVAVADVDGAPFEFNTGYVPGIHFEDDFETDAGWTLEGEWEIGEPLGLGTAPGDPTTAYTGVQVLGHDLSGQGTFPGDYERGAVENATSPVIDASSLSNAELTFEAWLNVAPEGIARVEVRDASGVWQAVYTSSASGGVTQTPWTGHWYDVSFYADGNAAFQIRFMQLYRTAIGHDAGWNVDKLVLRDGGLPPFAACGGCGGAPTFAGVASVTDDDPCADSGVTLQWGAAPSWGTGSTGTYAVYRDTVPGFTPGPANLIAGGIGGTSWTDPAAPADVQVHYVVRAENDETCDNGPANGGVTDDNLVYGTAVNATSQTAPEDVGATLYADPVNRAHARLSWSATAGAASYRVYRADHAAAAFQLVGETTTLVYEDAEVLGDGLDGYYEVRASDACGNEGP
jgi:hypothetical protein